MNFAQTQDVTKPNYDPPSKQISSDDARVFSVDTSLIKKVNLAESSLEGCSHFVTPANQLQEIGLEVYDQNDLEQGILAQVDEAVAKQEKARIKAIRDRDHKAVTDDIRTVEQEITKLENSISSDKKGSVHLDISVRNHVRAVWSQKENKLKQLKKLKAKETKLLGLLHGQDDKNSVQEEISRSSVIFNKSTTETDFERSVRLGEMTPFGTDMSVKVEVTDSISSRHANDQKPSTSHECSEFGQFLAKQDDVSTRNARRKFPPDIMCETQSKKRKLLSHYPTVKSDLSHNSLNTQCSNGQYMDKVVTTSKQVSDQSTNELDQRLIPVARKKHSDDDFIPGSSPSSDECSDDSAKLKNHKLTNIAQRQRKSKSLPFKDDGNAAYYEKRMKRYRYDKLMESNSGNDDLTSDTEFDGGLRIKHKQWNKLYRYQRTCVKWLWELHCQEAGGIIGDEMGMGKTIQLIVFLGALRYSQLPNNTFRYTGLGPTLIVCPATVMMQWVREFHKWQPEFRVAILHSTGSFVTSEAALIQNIVKCNGVIITSYSSLVLHQASLLKHSWHYVVLDEGHKIRNPDAQTTLCVKQFRTPHRLILSGSPIQNSLKELWSLLDFVFPGKLGMLPDFMQHFAIPITQGGYANATQVQVQTAYKCACVLRDTINPYLLRRLKADVKMSLQLPAKNEQVLFCRLTDHQRDVYQQYLDSDECKAILGGRYKVFVGLITLRKICNHPDISTGGPRILIGQNTQDDDPESEYGYYRRSGKMVVLASLLKIWKQQSHKVLLFTQSRAMLSILQRFVQQRNYTYLKMDGGTTISSRQALIQKFNQDPDIFLFLLTTRVGGIGVNLTGANRVIIYDPDWNPSTDIQARERSWRIGQDKEVTIYRLLTTGTIEEKIYHRQIFKQFLTNRVLLDPKQRRFFKSNDLFELFTLGNKRHDQKTETSAIFSGTGSGISVPRKINRPVVPADTEKSKRLLRMREMAKSLSHKIAAGKYDSVKDKKVLPIRVTKKRPTKKCAMFEGDIVPNLVRQESYRKSSGTTTDTSAINKAQDDYVLRKLFTKSGVEEAFQHDVIVNSTRHDYALVEGEAERVAMEAAAALKKSRAHCNSAISGIPTWTGRAPNKKLRFGQKKNTRLTSMNEQSIPTVEGSDIEKLFDGNQAGSVRLKDSAGESPLSSKELILRMKHRNKISSEGNNNTNIASSDIDTSDNNDYNLLCDIRSHIACRCRVDGEATTSEILDELSPRLPPSDNSKFKAMLNEICTFHKEDDVGIWRLKEGFR